MAQTENILTGLKRKDVETMNQRLDRLYAALSHCNQAIVRCSSEAELFVEVCRVAVTFGGMSMAWIGMVDEQGRLIHPIASFGKGSEYLEGLRIPLDVDDPLGLGASASALRENRPIWYQDFQQTPVPAQWQEHATRLGWVACASLPLHRNSAAAGVFTLYIDVIGAFDDKARDLLEEMTSDIDFALQNFEREAQRVQAENELRKSEQRMRTILRTASDGIHILDNSGLLVDANDAFLNMLGYDESAIGKLRVTDWDVHVPSEGVKETLNDQMAHNSQVRFETHHRCRNGSILDIEVSTTVIEIEGHKYIYAASRDITKRKRLDSALRESEARFRTLTEDAPEAILIHDIESGMFVDATDSAERLFACSRDEILRHGPEYFYAPNQPHNAPSLENIKERGARILAGEHMKFERLVKNCNGEEIICEVRLVRLPSTNRKLVRASYIDITERKHAERQLQIAAIAFESQQGMFITDAKGAILRVNQAFIDITGYSAEEAVHQPRGFLRQGLFNEADYAEMGKCLRERGYWEGEVLRRRKDGETFSDWSTVSVVRDEAGKLVNLVISMTDITERKKTEENLRKLSMAVEQSPESIVITNLNAEIEYVNDAFIKNTGYSQEEVIGQNPRILNSGKTPPETYKFLWDSISKGTSWDGLFYNRRKDGSEYIEHAIITPIRQEDGRITHYVAVKEDITDKKMASDMINTLAFYDTLTGLPNRRLLLDRLKHVLAAGSRSKRMGALLFIDLDNFKTLNDTLGHDVGDLLLQQVSQRLTSCVREGDTVARFGGDEFVVMLENLSDTSEEAAAQAEVVGEKIMASLNQTYQLGNYPHHSTPSIGIALFSEQQQSVDDLLKQADLAMYQAKAAGRNTLIFFNPEMQTLISNRAGLEEDLREAVLQHQFLLYYQPQVVGDGRLTGAEVLLRWRHPQRGMVPPGEFIPLAEETGLIQPIGRWVLETACHQLAKWAGQPEMAHLTIAVNVSARQFGQPTFVDEVLTILEHCGANPKKLKLELTESILLNDVEGVITKMSALKMKGVGFSLDDFGTGYSSLSYLKRLPLDQLKIDQSFVRNILTDPDDAAIAKMVVALAESMGLSVIAEGVEMEAQRDFLARHGCHAYQGYLFGRPIPLDEFEDFVKKV